MKKLVSSLLALTLCLGLAAPTALAVGDFTVNDGVLTKYHGANANVTIPDSVAEIGKGAFADCTSLESVTIPDSVTSIGNSAFSGCYKLKSVSIGSGVTSIGDSAFSDCEFLTGIEIPAGVKSIGEYAFEGCTKLTELTVPDGVESIKQGTFADCPSLTKVTIPGSVGDISGEAFGKGRASKRRERKSTRDNEGFTICGADGSWAQIWAMERGEPFAATLPTAATPGRTAYAATQTILVDGEPVEFQAYALRDKDGNDTNYVKLRDVASVLNGTRCQFDVGWDGKVTITTKTAYKSNGTEMNTPYSGDRTYAQAEKSTVLVNNKAKGMLTLLLKDSDGNGYTYFKLRDLGEILNFKVGWNADTGVTITTK